MSRGTSQDIRWWWVVITIKKWKCPQPSILVGRAKNATRQARDSFQIDAHWFLARLYSGSVERRTLLCTSRATPDASYWGISRSTLDGWGRVVLFYNWTNSMERNASAALASRWMIIYCDLDFIYFIYLYYFVRQRARITGCLLKSAALFRHYL